MIPANSRIELARTLGKSRNRARTFATSGTPAPSRAIQMLRAFGLPEDKIPGENLAELEKVLTTDYSALPALPAAGLARELARVLDEKGDPGWMARTLRGERQNSLRLSRSFGSSELMVSGEPYLAGSGLSLWGFSFSGVVGEKEGFFIFANTAHQTGAVAATIEHELGHFIFQGMGLAESGEVASMEPTFARHLEEKEEMFCDSVVALSTYRRDAVRKISARRESLASRIQAAWESTHPSRRIDPVSSAPTPLWRVRYLTALIHFFKLRAALLETAGI